MPPDYWTQAISDLSRHDAAMAELKAQGEAVYRIGKIRARQGDEAQTVVV